MVNRERLVNEFIELARVDSLSLKERDMADLLTAKLKAQNLEIYEDDAGAKAGGNSGNVICSIKGNRTAEPVLLMAHMDTVGPGTGKKPVVEGNIIKSDGTTVLGADDAAGIACILETLRVIRENDLVHGDIQIVFTIGEEVGLLGSKNLDWSKIHAKYGFVLDMGEVGAVGTSSCTAHRIDIEITGKAAHAGVEPEKGVSAVQIASEAIANMKLGRIDAQTTANIGIISGGRAVNIVCDHVKIQGEARSRYQEKLNGQTAHMRDCFERSAKKYGGSIGFKSDSMFPPYEVKESDSIMHILRKAADSASVALKPQYVNGGSDTNYLNGKGITAVNIGVGMDKVHTTQEQIDIDDLALSAEFLVAIIQSVERTTNN